MRKVGLRIGDSYLDLFPDEQITLVRKASNYKDLGKVFSDYTQSFTIPATANNNRILRHYCDMTVLNGYGQSEPIEGFVEVDTLPVRSGSFIIEGCTLQDGVAKHYELMFYGRITTLKDLFGNDKLADLDLSIYDHAYNFTNVETGVEGASGLFSGKVFYPLISPTRKWTYDSTSSSHTANNIAYHSGHSGNEHGIYYYELKPALQLAAIVDAIKAKYGISISSTFLSSAAFRNLFMWLHNKEGELPRISQPYSRPMTGVIGSHVWNDVDKTIKLAYDCPYITFLFGGSFGMGNYNYEIYVNGTLRISSATGITGFATISPLKANDVIHFRFSTASPLVEETGQLNVSFDDGVSIPGTLNYFIDYTTTGDTETIYYSYAYINRIMPEMKVEEFMSGLIKMFNLIVYPSGNNFIIEPLQDWLDAGNTIDLSRQIDLGEMKARKSDLYGVLSFNYSEPATIAAETYKANTGLYFGDLEAKMSFEDAQNYEVKLPFEMLLMERLFDDNDGVATNLLTGAAIEDLTEQPKPAMTKPIILYYIERQTSLTKSFNLLTAAGADNEVTAYNMFGTSSEKALSANTLTLTFGADVDPYFGAAVSRGLYQEYYSERITAIYDPRAREVEVSAILTLPQIITLEMNDTVIIGDKLFYLDEVKVNINTGKTQLKLIHKV